MVVSGYILDIRVMESKHLKLANKVDSTVVKSKQLAGSGGFMKISLFTIAAQPPRCYT